MIASDGHIKLIDFGLVMKKDDVVNDIAGTLEYMAPEVLNIKNENNCVNHMVDFWSLGILLYEMLNGYGLIYIIYNIIHSSL